MILMKVKNNRVFTKDTLEKCKDSFDAQKKCEKEACKAPAMGNGFCRWHGGVNTDQQKHQKDILKRKRANSCNRARQALKRNNKNLYESVMKKIEDFKGVQVNDE
jgi:hypothetical protein